MEDAGCREKINSASLGVGGEREKNSQRTRKRPAFEVRVFPAPGPAKRTGQPQTSHWGARQPLGSHALPCSFALFCSLAVALRICNAGKAREVPVFVAIGGRMGVAFMSQDGSGCSEFPSCGKPDIASLITKVYCVHSKVLIVGCSTPPDPDDSPFPLSSQAESDGEQTWAGQWCSAERYKVPRG
jgi:hypothetical protein